ncbi:MAG: MarR family transcriptional regulator [Terriglobia bacterium]|jgi:DNA-binding MarR family transcriptional regulator|nr:MarR family transcriptional regulator [Terriglobia bacterium]
MQTTEHLDYHALSEFRYQIRRFLHFSEMAARAAGIEPKQHQLLLAMKGLPADLRPTVRNLAERMQLKHHSAVELIDRLERSGLVARHRAERDRREVLVQLLPKGERLLRALSLHHQNELRNSGPKLAQTLRRLISRPAMKAPVQSTNARTASATRK